MIVKFAGIETFIVEDEAAGNQQEGIKPPDQVTVGPVTIGSIVTGYIRCGFPNHSEGTIISS